MSTCGDGTTGGVEVHVDGFGRVFGFEEEELSNDDVSGVVGDGSVDANDALLEETGEDVVGSLSSGRVLYHHWDQAICSTARCRFRSPSSTSMEQTAPEHLCAPQQASHGSHNDTEIGR